MACETRQNDVSFENVRLDYTHVTGDGTSNNPASIRNKQGDQTVTPERAKWSRKLDFILSAVGYAVGFGNVWRFPYLCYSNGGGAFLIPYILMMVFAGLPLFYMELALGQYASLGPISVWRVCPIFTGLGYTMIGLNLLVSVYYNVILALSIFYLIASFARQLPWATCGKPWNKNCYLNLEEVFEVFPGNGTHFSTHHFSSSLQSDLQMTTVSSSLLNTSIFNNCTDAMSSCWLSNYTQLPNTTVKHGTDVTSGIGNSSVKSPAEEYWLYYVLGVTDNTNIGNIGTIRWHLVLCHLLAWIIVLLCIIKGIKSSGKVVYFTATFPYVVLLVLFIRGVTLPGAVEGIKFYLVPNFSKMATVKVWNDAAIQILFSLGPGFGSLIMLGSYNNFHSRCDKDAVIVTLINCFTSVFAGFVIFSVLGFMSVRRGLAVDQVVDKGPGLAFIAYPEALSMMPGAPFWSICFFFMLLTLGLDSQFVGVESIITGLMDEFPIVAKWKKTSTVVLCIVLFLTGLSCVTQGAMYVVELIDQFTTSFPLLIVTFLEAVVISWIYGIHRFSTDIEMMIGRRPNYYWLACWLAITPLIILFILIFKSIEYKGLYFGQYRYPAWAEGIGWLIVAVLIGIIPFMGIVNICQCIGSWQNFWWVITRAAPINIWKLHQLWHPSPQWGPSQISSSHEENKRTSHLEANNKQESDSKRFISCCRSCCSKDNKDDEISNDGRRFSFSAGIYKCNECHASGRISCTCRNKAFLDDGGFMVSYSDGQCFLPQTRKQLEGFDEEKQISISTRELVTDTSPSHSKTYQAFEEGHNLFKHSTDDINVLAESYVSKPVSNKNFIVSSTTTSAQLPQNFSDNKLYKSGSSDYLKCFELTQDGSHNQDSFQKLDGDKDTLSPDKYQLINSSGASTLPTSITLNLEQQDKQHRNVDLEHLIYSHI